MTIAWMIYALVVGALLAFAANTLADATRRLGLPTRPVWGIAMLSLVALCISAPLRTTVAPIRIGGLNVVEGHALPAQPATITLAQRIAAVRGAIGSVEQAATTAITRALPRGTPEAFPLVWMTTSALVATLMFWVSATMRRKVAAWPRTELHGARVRLTPDVGPAVVGFAAPEIVIPGWLLARSPEEQQLALAHERQHMLAHDHWLLAFGWLIVALMPWHPASWWMLGRLRLAIELDCDKRVLRSGAATRSYGQMLIDIADHCSGQRALTLALADRTSHLERRLLAMKKPRARFGRTRATMLAAMGAFAVLVACESKMPTSAEIENADVASLERKATEVALVNKAQLAQAIYVVDGHEVSDSAAHALKANDVATVNITKTVSGNKIFVTTLDAPQGRKGEGVAVHDSAMTAGSRNLYLTKSNKKFDGLYVIDGQVASPEQFSRLDPQRIESVEVFKGVAAQQRYSDPAAANGVISVKTKQ